ncbi:MAG: DUF3786 domain-containing protein [Desulfobacterales bacterium]|jgi:hypothetical protein|nr:DUF3786 domain-containing protein [Desulfobacteraceae bacterium]MBT7085907.1 DUF3786 domain-containing protein [Desulfobacterales bacterium]MBT7696445.1 DUF3786 domain-containing protein [Desulfobacterales bacterium]
MNKKAEVFEKTYEDYLKQLSEIELSTKAEILGADISGENLIIPFYGESYNVSGSGITDSRGRKANFSICVALSKYILMCPEEMSENISEKISNDEKWVTFREFKDAGPLTVSFVNNTNKTIQNSFQDNQKALEEACKNLGGIPFYDNSSHDLSMSFKALPRIPVLLRFNFKDDDFPAQCSVLFKQSAQNFLDMESLAIAGTFLAGGLINFNNL